MSRSIKTLKELRDEVDRLSSMFGEDTPVTTERNEPIAAVRLIHVLINNHEVIVASEEDDDTRNLKDGQRNAIQIK